MVGEQSGRP